MNHGHADSSIIDWCCQFSFSADGIEKIDHMGSRHISSTSQSCARFFRSRFIVFDHFSTPVIEDILTPIDKYRTFATIDHRTPSGTLGVICIPASSVPLTHPILRTSQSSFDAVVHLPSILREVSFRSFDGYPHRNVHLEGPSCEVQFVRGIISCFCRSIIPAIPMPVVVPGL